MVIVAIDIGATWTRVAVFEQRRMLAKKVFRTAGGEKLLERIVEAVLELVDRGSIDAIGVGTIGPLDIRRGTIVKSPNIGGKTIELGKPLAKALGAPTYIVNDCVAAVWGEYVYGIGSENLVYITLSTGVGGGAIVDGHLLLGRHGNAHEIGHMVVDVTGFMECGCGGRGHWEAYAGGANIPKFAKKLVQVWAEKNPDIRRHKFYQTVLEGVTVEKLYQTARQGDKLARAIVDEINRYNVAGFTTTANVYDPDTIAVGGSIALNNKDLVLEPIARAVRESRDLVTAPPKILPATFGHEAVLYGAAAIAEEPPKHLLKAIEYNTNNT